MKTPTASYIAYQVDGRRPDRPPLAARLHRRRRRWSGSTRCRRASSAAARPSSRLILHRPTRDRLSPMPQRRRRPTSRRRCERPARRARCGRIRTRRSLFGSQSRAARSALCSPPPIPSGCARSYGSSPTPRIAVGAGLPWGVTRRGRRAVTARDRGPWGDRMRPLRGLELAARSRREDVPHGGRDGAGQAEPIHRHARRRAARCIASGTRPTSAVVLPSDARARAPAGNATRNDRSADRLRRVADAAGAGRRWSPARTTPEPSTSTRCSRRSARFLGLARRCVRPATRVLATVLFTDIVGSTRRRGGARRHGWKRAARATSRAVAGAAVARHRGNEVDTAGDGFFATFDGPARAVRCAQAIVARVRRARASRSGPASTPARSSWSATRCSGLAVSRSARA